jgi:hypothetical protein
VRKTVSPGKHASASCVTPAHLFETFVARLLCVTYTPRGYTSAQAPLFSLFSSKTSSFVIVSLLNRNLFLATKLTPEASIKDQALVEQVFSTDTGFPAEKNFLPENPGKYPGGLDGPQ